MVTGVHFATTCTEGCQDETTSCTQCVAGCRTCCREGEGVGERMPAVAVEVDPWDHTVCGVSRVEGPLSLLSRSSNPVGPGVALE